MRSSVAAVPPASLPLDIALDGQRPPRDVRRQGAAKVFAHKGIWIRPSTVGSVIGSRHARGNTAAFEEHGGIVDASLGVDLGRAVLAFEYIDQVNDDMLQNYLPQVDASLSSELGLKHDPLRLASADEMDDTAENDHYASKTPDGDASTTSGWVTDRGGTSVSPYDGLTRSSVVCSASPWGGFDGSSPEVPEDLMPRASSRATSEIIKAPRRRSAPAEQRGQASSPPPATQEAGRDSRSSSFADSEKGTNERSSKSKVNKLCTVDSFPDSVQPRYETYGDAQDKEPSVAESFIRKSMIQDSLALSDLAQMLGRVSLIKGLPDTQSDQHDPGTPASTFFDMYGVGASRVRRPGQYKALKAQYTPRPPRTPKTPRLNLPIASRAVTVPLQKQGTLSVRSVEPFASNPSAAGGGVAVTAASSSRPPSGRLEAPSPSPASRRPTGEEMEEMFGVSRDGAIAERDPPVKTPNSACPFSHAALDHAGAVDLRCGHRFALARLNTARRGAESCFTAGLSLKDALICPLCGDQDNTSKPGARDVLTTYSRNTDAYLGGLRKDWQEPLLLPIDDKRAGDQRSVVSTLARPRSRRTVGYSRPEFRPAKTCHL